MVLNILRKKDPPISNQGVTSFGSFHLPFLVSLGDLRLGHCQLLTSHRPNNIHQPPLLPPRLHGLTASRRSEDTQLRGVRPRQLPCNTSLAALTSARQPSTTQRSNLSLPAVIQSPHNTRAGTNLLLSIREKEEMSRGKIN